MMSAENTIPTDEFTAVEIRILPVAAASSPQSLSVPDPLRGTAEYLAELSVESLRGFQPVKLNFQFDKLLRLNLNAEDYGQALGEMLFADDALGIPYRTALGYGQGKLRVRLRIDPPELHELHWERIYHPRNGFWRPLSSTADTPFSRFLLARRWDRPLPVDQHPLRLLAVIASPSDLADSYLLDPIDESEREYLHEMFDKLQPHIQTTYLESGTANAPTLKNLRRCLSEGFHIIHFLCHGARTANGTVLYIEEKTGRVSVATKDDLVSVFSALAEAPTLCFLASCETARRYQHNSFTPLGPALVEEGGVYAVVAMTDKIGLATAQLFSDEFYTRLLHHGTVDRAMNEARAVVQGEWDWGVPVLFSRLPDNQLIDLSWTVSPEISRRSQTLNELLRRRRMREDWGEAHFIEGIFGREEESAQIRKWIEVDEVKLVAIYGLGGIGKTTLALSVAKEIQNSFECIFWRSLQNEYRPEDYLRQCIQFILARPPASLPDTFESLLTLFIESLRENRCLLMLDNLETVLGSGQQSGKYRKGYEGYSKIFESLSNANIKSCIMITSREKLREIPEGDSGQVRILRLEGLHPGAARQVLESKEFNLFGTDEEWMELAENYGGSPLALRILPDYINGRFGGQISRFLQESQAIIGDIGEVMQQQIDRLSSLELQSLFWLAIEREPVTIDDLSEDIFYLSRSSGEDLYTSLASLNSRALVESRGPGRYALQPVVMEFIIETLVNRIVLRIREDKIEDINLYALTKAHSKDYLRQIQSRLILQPIADQLVEIYGSKNAKQKVMNLLALLQGIDPLSAPDKLRGYAAANLLNLLLALKADLRDIDFSRAVIRQADLQNASLQDVDFSDATFESSFFHNNFEGIISIRFNPAGNLLATGTSTGEIWLWNVIYTSSSQTKAQSSLIHSFDLKPLRVLEGHSDMVHDVCFSSDGVWLVSGSEDGSVRMWEVGTGNLRWKTNAHANQVYSVAINSEGSIVASAGDDREVQLWDSTSGQRVRCFTGHTGWLRTVAFSPDGTLVASGGDDHGVRIWDIETGKTVHDLTGHQKSVRSVRFNPQGNLLVSTSTDQATRFWDIRSGKPIKVLQGSDEEIGRAVFGPDGQCILSCADEHTVRLWNLSDGRILETLTSDRHRINTADFSPDGLLLAFGGEDHTIQVWEVNSGQCLRVLHGFSNWLKSVVYSSNGKFLVSCGDDKMIRYWDVSSASCLRSFTAHNGHIRSVALNQKADVLASCSDDGTIGLWDVETGEPLGILRGHSDRVWDISFSPDGRLLASASFDLTVRLWDVQTGGCVKILKGHKGQVRSVNFRPDGTLLASCGDDREVLIWDIETGDLVHALKQHTDVIWDIAFSSDGRLIASASGDETICLWDANEGKLINILRGHDGSVWSVAFNADDTRLASSGSDMTIRLWQIGDAFSNVLQSFGLGRLARKPYRSKIYGILEGHSGIIRSISFNSDGHRLASCGHDGTIRLWDVDKQQLINTLQADRPYERMNIARVSGLTPAQRSSLKALGAIEE